MKNNKRINKNDFFCVALIINNYLYTPMSLSG